MLGLYDQGVICVHPHVGAVVLPKTEITAVYFYDAVSQSGKGA